jgi:hypothetical protein
MITDKITSLYRADILRCKADAINMQRVVLDKAIWLPESDPLRDEWIRVGRGLGDIAVEYDSMMEPSEKQRKYWDIISQLK